MSKNIDLPSYKRPVFQSVLKRLREPSPLIQVLLGPRQVGKTTLAKQLCSEIKVSHIYASADGIAPQDGDWIEQQWNRALSKLNQEKDCLLVIDEIQKIKNWSEHVKALWDTHLGKKQLKVLLLGSSQLLLHKGLTESLAGRFELIPITHWTYKESTDGFGLSFDEYIFFGSYPGSYKFIKDVDRWKNYIKQSLIETTLSKDILLTNRIDKPALLRQVFELGCLYSGKILSFTKMLGQLQDAGNTTTISHYIHLLAQAGLLIGLNKYAGDKARQRSSSPKLQVYNNALLTAQSEESYEEARKNSELWGRLTESAVGSHIINQSLSNEIKVFYWRGKDTEVDFVISTPNQLFAIEVKSSITNKAFKGLKAFSRKFSNAKKLVIGSHGIPIEEFLSSDLESFLNN
ncbi:MAG: ATP-binding protein [Bdellovibrionota bacterium]